MLRTISKKTLWVLFIVLCIVVGLYPLTYFIFWNQEIGLLAQKSASVLNSSIWQLCFYIHIVFGGIALLSGWSQFSKKIRDKRISIHRALGKTYLISVLLSGSTALYIGFYATGGAITAVGFICLGIIWLYTSYKSYVYIKMMDIDNHQKMMIFSYACCFAAVTLRLWMPILMASFGDFTTAYQIVAWLCWIPNLIVAFVITQKRQSSISVSPH